MKIKKRSKESLFHNKSRLLLKTAFVTPYLSIGYQRNHLKFHKRIHDIILYPHIEDKPLKFAVSYRNKYMVESADCVIAYVDHNSGGAYVSYKHAIRIHKEVFNLVDFA